MRGWFFLFLLLAAILRVSCLGTNPAGVFHDEAEKGYSALSVLKIGGVLDFVPRPGAATWPVFHPFPLFVNVWGSTTSMIYQYAAAPFVAVGGLNAWTLRLPAALAGTLTVALAFFLALALTGSRAVALWAMLLLAVSPWHLMFSRWAQQGIFVPLLVSTALVLLFRALNDSRRRIEWMGGAVAFGLAFYAYSGAQPFLLLFWCWLAVVWRRELLARRKMVLAAAAVLALTLLPTFYSMLRGGGAGMGRFNTLSVFKAADEAGNLLPLAARALLFIKNYLSHFSPQFLFFTGDALPRHGLPGFGVMLHVEAVFLIAGILRATHRRAPGDLVLLGWFLLFPFSAALTREGIPHALRTLHAVPCPQILSAVGAAAITDWLRAGRRPVLAAFPGALVCLNALAIVFSLFLVFPRWSAPWFEAGIGEALHLTRGAGRTVVISGGAQDGGNLPFYYELYYYHAVADPRALLKAGTPLNANPVLLPPGTDPADALSLLPGALVVSALDFRNGYAAVARGQGWTARPVLFKPSLTHPEPAEALWVIFTKPPRPVPGAPANPASGGDTARP